MKSRILELVTAGLLSALMAANVEASTVQFTYSVLGRPSWAWDTLTWYEPLSPTPTRVTDGFFELPSVPGDPNGGGSNPLLFYTAGGGGGFQATGGGANFFSSQLFTGSVSNPTFLTGIFNGTEGGNCEGCSGYTASLTISAVPEPGTLALLSLGLLGLGFTARRRLH